VDDHVHLQAAPDGRVFAVVKTNRDGTGELNHILYRRSAAGTWSARVPVNRVGDPIATRPRPATASAEGGRGARTL